MARERSSDLQAVAHDLRSSLRAISIYSDLLVTEVQLAQPDAAKIEKLRVSITEAIDSHSSQLHQLAEFDSAIDVGVANSEP